MFNDAKKISLKNWFSHQNIELRNYLLRIHVQNVMMRKIISKPKRSIIRVLLIFVVLQFLITRHDLTQIELSILTVMATLVAAAYYIWSTSDRTSLIRYYQAILDGHTILSKTNPEGDLIVSAKILDIRPKYIYHPMHEYMQAYEDFIEAGGANTLEEIIDGDYLSKYTFFWRAY